MVQTAETSKELTVGEVAARSGVAVSALHFYESKGLISSRRTGGNQRRYHRDTLRRVAFIRVSQRVGIPLDAIRDALATLPEGRTPTRDDWARLSATWRRELDDRIEQLLQLRDDLTDCIGCGCLSLQRCRLSNPGDMLAAEGPGPRRLVSRRVTRPPAGGDQRTTRPPASSDQRTTRPAAGNDQRTTRPAAGCDQRTTRPAAGCDQRTRPPAAAKADGQGVAGTGGPDTARADGQGAARPSAEAVDHRAFRPEWVCPSSQAACGN
ncbi:hypothetical protein Acy02nite_77700 [Actinoplanes cyaneus]|uniref:HTH merR-type domain-containing protein n=1 Tax=Actinoplanes cyaneus TaxID=52696 RepID=A0A919MBR5_9ACTN|nr:redox-sensitive transcriptional activator SoxR [Actinoplanes cyaneus]GID69889.1 hypothetical protein Acy02nite_77700 [Actinoplanes cyaneus]